MAAGSRNEDDFISQINVTPLVDVMLVLLVVMMVTASTVVAQALDVQLPQGSTGAAATEPLVLQIDVAGVVRLDGNTVSDAALQRLAAERVARDADQHALVAADGAVAHKHVVHVMDVLREQGLTQVAIAVTPVP